MTLKRFLNIFQHFPGYPKPDLIWKHNGEIIERNEKYRFLFADAESMSLIVRNITAEDAGSYSVEAINELGEDKGEIKVNVKCKKLHEPLSRLFYSKNNFSFQLHPRSRSLMTTSA